MSQPGAERFEVAVGSAVTTAAFSPATSPGPGDRRGLLMFAHGAGSDMHHRMTVSLATLFRDCGLDVVRFNFLYRQSAAGRPDPMPRLIECYAAVVEDVRRRLAPGRLFIGGQSMGGRAATMMAADGFRCDGLILTAYPLHPAGRPEQMRDTHLPRITAPVLCFNGTRDALCERKRMERVLTRLPATWTMHWVDAADHGFRVLKRSGRTDEDVRREIAAATRAWLSSHSS